MNYGQQFETIGRKQLAIQEGINLLQQIRGELSSNRASAEAWGKTAILANVVIIPLNIIINAFELKTVNTAYQMIVRQLYGKFGKSGTRVDGHVKTALSLLKRGIIEELKRKAMTEFVPGINILVGLSEDSLAALQAIQIVESGNSEISSQFSLLNMKIAAANHQLVQLGIRRAEILARLQEYARTA